MDFENGIETPAHVKVLVEPIGEISGKEFERYFDLIRNSFNVLPLSSLTRFPKENRKSPLTNQDWKGNSLRLRFTMDYDPSVKIKQKLCERVHGFIGIMSCKSDIQKSYAKYEKRVKMIPEATTHRLLAVEYYPDVKPILEEENNKMEELTIILPTPNIAKQRFYLESAICDISNSLVRDFESRIRTKDRSCSDISRLRRYAENALLCGSFLDAEESLRRAIKLNMKSTGVGIIECKEDLLSCIYFIEQKKVMESKRRALQGSYGGSSSGGAEKMKSNCLLDETLRNRLMKMYSEVIELYEKRRFVYPHLCAALLRYVKLLLLIVRLLEEEDLEKRKMNFSGNENENTSYISHSTNVGEEEEQLKINYLILELLEKAVVIQEGFRNSPELIRAKIQVLNGVSQIYQSIGYSRKCGSVFLKLARLYYDTKKIGLAIENTLKAFPAFHIPLFFSTDIPKENSRTYTVDEKALREKRGWGELQCSILRELIMYCSPGTNMQQRRRSRSGKRSVAEMDKSSTVNFNLLRVRLIFFMLSTYHSILGKTEQEYLFNELNRATSSQDETIRFPKSCNVCLTEFPILAAVYPVPSTDKPYLIADLNDKKKDPGNPFIFVPKKYQKAKKRGGIRWVVNETAQVELYLYNPFEKDILLKTVQLKVNLDCVIYATGNILRAKTIMKLKIYLLPNSPGDLRIENVSFFFNKIPNKLEIKSPFVDTIEVVESIPAALCRFTMPALSLYEGEEIQNKLVIQNISEKDITKMEIKVVNNVENVIRIEWDENLLPLKRKDRLIVPFSVCIRERINQERSLKNRDFVFRIRYGNERWERSKKVSLKVKCLKSLKVITTKEEETGMVMHKVANISKKNFVVYLKNGKSVPIPPNYTKELKHEILFFESQNKLKVNYANLKDE